jgi:Ca2+/H+ antiporter
VSPEWLGLVLLAVYVPASLLHAVHLPACRVGNAAEHVTAVFVAYRNKVDLALAVSVGSCIQIALFVIPLLVLLSKQILPASQSRMLTGRAGWIMGKPMSLLCALLLPSAFVPADPKVDSIRWRRSRCSCPSSSSASRRKTAGRIT